MGAFQVINVNTFIDQKTHFMSISPNIVAGIPLIGQ